MRCHRMRLRGLSLRHTLNLQIVTSSMSKHTSLPGCIRQHRSGHDAGIEFIRGKQGKACGLLHGQSIELHRALMTRNTVSGTKAVAPCFTHSLTTQSCWEAARRRRYEGHVLAACSQHLPAAAACQLHPLTANSLYHSALHARIEGSGSQAPVVAISMQPMAEAKGVGAWNGVKLTFQLAGWPMG